MEFKKIKVKKSLPVSESENLPRGKTVTGIFNGFHVVINDWESINKIYNNGNFGKGNLSKSHPHYNIAKNDVPKVILEDQFRIESKWMSHIPCSYSGLRNNWSHDLELSFSSINNLLNYAVKNSLLNSSNSWKQVKRKVTDNNGGQKPTKSNVFWEESKDSDIYQDEEFSKTVNTMLKKGRLMETNFTKSNTGNLVIVVDHPSEVNTSDMSINNFSARLETRPLPISESLTLNLEEAFFLNFALGSLRIIDLREQELEISDLWTKFCKLEINFFERYVIYHYYRSKGWIVQSGLKYGGDYLLYKDGPSYSHASYVVKIISGDKINSWNEFLLTNRLVETFNKDVLYCMVIKKWSSFNEDDFFNKLINCEVLEVLSRRGLSSKNKS